MKRLNLPKEKVFIGPALLWKRIGAFLIDMMILVVFVMYPFRKLFERILPSNYSFSEMFNLLGSVQYTGYLVSIYLAYSILILMYFYFLEKKMGQTIGKKIMNIYVVSDTDNLKRWQFFVRNLVFIPVFPFDLLVLADPLFMIFTKTNQRLSEILSRTKVVEKFNYENF